MYKFTILCPLLLLIAASGCVSTNTATGTANVKIDRTFGRYEDELESELILITMKPAYHARLTEQSINDLEGELPRRYSVFLERMNQRYGLSRVADWPLSAINIYCIIFELEGDQPRDEIVAALNKEYGVESAQTVNEFQTQAEEYNDPYLSLQHGLETMQAVGSHAWSRGKGVRIAVVDTGTDNTHPDLLSSMELTRNFVDTDKSRFQADVHGTAVGGIIAAAADNNTGIVGVAPEASLLALKACWHAPDDLTTAKCNTLTLAKALNFSISENVDIINLSLTGPPDPLLDRLVAEALQRDIIVVGALPSHQEPAFPVSIPGTIAVAALGSVAPIISAPGSKVISTRPGQQYDYFNGSSFATAHIAGLAAVIRSMSPKIKPAELLTLLENTADADTGSVNACRAVMAVSTSTTEPNSREQCL